MLYDKTKLKAIRLLVFSSKTKKEIAEELQITEQTLYNWLKDRNFNDMLNLESKVYYSYMKKQTFKKLTGLVVKALGIIENSLSSKDERLRLRSAFDILKAYANFEDLKLLDRENINELSEFVINANITDYDLKKLNEFESYESEKLRKAIEKREEAKKIINVKETELLGFEDDLNKGLEPNNTIEQKALDKAE